MVIKRLFQRYQGLDKLDAVVCLHAPCPEVLGLWGYGRILVHLPGPKGMVRIVLQWPKGAAVPTIEAFVLRRGSGCHGE